MRVKRFQAKDMAEAMRKVKAELGPNAIILHSRDLTGGLFGWFSKKGVEVTAGVDKPNAPKPKLQSKQKNNQNSNPSGRPSASPPVGGKLDIKISDQTPSTAASKKPATTPDNPLLALAQKLESEKNKQNQVSETPACATNTDSKPTASNGKQDKPEKDQPTDAFLESRLSSLENQLIKLTGLIENIAPSILSGKSSSVPTRTRELYNHLLEQDVDEHLALTIATNIAETTDDQDDSWTALKTYLTTKIPVAEPIEIDPNQKSPHVIMLVGPTGVGKTTTLAKISAQYRYNIKHGVRPKIAFITADLFRLAAVEQLQKYTEILGVDLEVTYSADEVKQAMSKHKNTHLILFDTAGTCQRNMPQMGTLSSIVDASHPTEVHLVISATTKYSDMVDIVDHFMDIKPTRLIFSKIDESTTFGPLLNTVMKYNIPISYLTTGQNVPEDIERARTERVAKLLLTKPTVNRSIDTKPNGEVKPNVSTTLNDERQTESKTNGSSNPIARQDVNNDTKHS